MMTGLARYAWRIGAGLLIATSASAQVSAKSKEQPKSKAQPKSTVKPKSTEPPNALQTRVWVNNGSKVYHCPGSIYYGKTGNGEFMEEAQARGHGNRAAQAQACKDVPTNGAAPLPFASNAARRMVWVNTESGVYHCPNSADWGATRRGRYLTESDASASGHKPAAGKNCAAR
jgi:hypothetical protein